MKLTTELKVAVDAKTLTWPEAGPMEKMKFQNIFAVKSQGATISNKICNIYKKYEKYIPWFFPY